MTSMFRKCTTTVPLDGTQGRFLKVLMDFTNRCNLKCIMCHFSIPGRDQLRDEIPIERFEEFAPQILPHVEHLGLSCATEPFMYPKFLDALPIVKKYEVPYVYYVTNATMLRDSQVIKTIESGIDLVMISIDGATKETFEKIRRGSNFDQILANTRLLRDKKIEMGSKTPVIRFNCTLMKNNVHELEDMIHLFKELGGEEIDIRHVTPFEGLETTGLSLFEHKELANRQLDRARALATELGLQIAYCPDNFDLFSSNDAEPKVSTEPTVDAEPTANTEPGPAPEPAVQDESIEATLAARSQPKPAASCRQSKLYCDMPWTMTVIHPDGGVVPCTYWFSHELLGNVNEQSFEEVWNGPKYQELRRQLITGELGPNCRHCPAMGSGDVNKEESFEARDVV